MKLFDTHCHINAEQFAPDQHEVIMRALAEGAERLMVVGCDREGIHRALSLIEQYDEMYASIAWHPVDVVDFKAGDYELLARAWDHPKVCAIGETGLDYHWDKSPKELQQQFFDWHIEQALERDMPFAIHDREAHGDVLRTLQKYSGHPNFRGVLHSFSGSVELAQEFLRLGLTISVSGVVTFKNAKHIKEVVKIVPADRLIVETDAPYLTPEPYRGKRNEPSYVKYVVEAIAQLRQEEVEAVAAYTTQNAKTLFGIK